MGAAWITGVCLRPNRLEWTVLRRAKEVWEIAAQGREDVVSAEGDAGWIPAAALKAHLKSFKGRVAVALPTERALVRVALLPSTAADELRGMAELQTDKFSPFPVETVAAGAETLAAAETSSLVAMAVVRREDVEAAGAAFQSAGAPPDAVDVEALGWWWGLKQSGALPAHGSQLALRVESSGAEMALVRDGEPLAFRALPGGPGAGDAADQVSSVAAAVISSQTLQAIRSITTSSLPGSGASNRKAIASRLCGRNLSRTDQRCSPAAKECVQSFNRNWPAPAS